MVVNNNVDRVAGLFYVSNGKFDTGLGSTQLKLDGIFLADSFTLGRDLDALNNSQPAEEFHYKPSLLFSAPSFLQARYTIWEEGF